MVLEQLGKAGVTLSELRRPFDRYAASGEINTRVDDPAAVIERVAEAYPADAQDRLDGLTVDLGDWWFNLRPSNTEPLLRLNLEAPDAARCAATSPRSKPYRPPRPSERSPHPMALDPQLLEILACPDDKGPLLYFEDEHSLYNPA